MRKAILSGLLLIVMVSSFGQLSTSSPAPTRQYYLTKAKNQSTAGKVLAIGGIASIVTPIIILAPGNTSLDGVFTGLTVIGVGTVAALGSIPLFMASERNKKRARKATTYINVEGVSYIKQQDMAFHRYPAVTIRIRF
ncbi:MAG: hypothetical protein WKF97_18735 [Chitinophagaceae bacterium]